MRHHTPPRYSVEARWTVTEVLLVRESGRTASDEPTPLQRSQGVLTRREEEMREAARTWRHLVRDVDVVARGMTQTAYLITIASFRKCPDDALIILCGGCAFGGSVSIYDTIPAVGVRYSCTVYED
jgi:hypothetical protein